MKYRKIKKSIVKNLEREIARSFTDHNKNSLGW